MKIKGVCLLTLTLVFTLVGLCFHLFAILTQRWIVTIPRRPRDPNDQIHYYGLWQRCQYSNTFFVMPDILSQPNIENFVCRPNFYLRYEIENETLAQLCYSNRHQCSSILGVPSSCQCQYLIVNRIEQILSIFVTISLVFAVIFLYLKLIASPQNASAAFLLTYSPLVFLTFALISILILLILIGVFLRRNQYEDFDIRLSSDFLQPSQFAPETVNFYRLNAFFRRYPNSTLFRQALRKFRSIHSERFQTRIDWSSISEIFALLSTSIAEIFVIILSIAQVH